MHFLIKMTSFFYLFITMCFFFSVFILKTATCYRVAKQFGQAKDYLLKASDCYKENRSLFHAARCYEQVWRLFIKFIISFKKFMIVFFPSNKSHKFNEHF